jgi:hypothetical protein
MIFLLLALLCFVAGAVVAAVHRTWELVLIASGLAFMVLNALPVHLG